MSTKSITKKLLIYLDPHPIRNIFTEFYNSEIRKLLPAIIRYMPEDYDVRIFSNNLTINEIAAAYPELCPALIRPFPLEDRKILSYFHQWDEKSISERSSLVLGLGEISEFYMGILERIHSDVFDFNCILIWSDNGAVKKFAKDNDIVLLCAESGPTRTPNVPTIYFDPAGTNGFASICKLDIDEIEPYMILPARAWATINSDKGSFEQPMVYDAPFTLSNNCEYIVNEKSIFIAMQLADDFNTVLCSPYNSPADFLKKIAEDFKDTGYKLIVKGHPGAKVRAYNLKKQAEAIRVLEGYDNVKIIEDDTDLLQTIKIYSHCSAVVSINSSLTYEALFSDCSSFVLGQALYNISGLLDYDKNKILSGIKISQEKIDKLTSFLCGHYLHPAEVVYNSDLIFKLFDFYIENRRDDISSAEMWKRYTETFREGFDLLRHENRIEKEVNHRNSINSILLNPAYKLNTFFSRDNDVYFQYSAGSPYVIYEQYACQTNVFEYSIEQFSTNQDRTRLVRGWAYNKYSLNPPVVVLIFQNGTFITQSRIITKRPDIQTSKGLQYHAFYGFHTVFKPKKDDNNDIDIMFVSEKGEIQIVSLGEKNEAATSNGKKINYRALPTVDEEVFRLPYHLFREGERVVIYGAGNVGRQFYKRLKHENKVNIIGIVDKNADNLRIENVPVAKVDELKKMSFDSILIAIKDPRVVNEVKNELKRRGISETKVRWDGFSY